jgi:hypothetical protein
MIMPNVDKNDDGIRPAGAPDECFYCKQKVGTPHLIDCFALHQRVKLLVTVEVEVNEPFHQTEAEIEKFEMHEGYPLIDLSESEMVSCKVIEMVHRGPYILKGPQEQYIRPHRN